MSNIIPFDTANEKLPSYLKAFNVSELNADLTAHARGGFPAISIKGKVFAVVRDGERFVIPNPKDPDAPATSIEVVIIKASKHVSKVYYAKGYDPKESDGAKPDCYSIDGVAPAEDAQNPQSKKCATCPHNQWGSRISDKGATKGKACTDTVRLAVAPAGQLNDPMLLRVPPASIRALGEYGQMLAKRGVGYNMVVTKIGFDPSAESPKLTFKPVGLLDEESFAEVQELATSEVVRDILGVSGPVINSTPVSGVAPAAVENVVVNKAPTTAEAALTNQPPKAATAEKQPKPKKETKPAVVEEDDEIDIEGIDFDD